jgi:dGTPase
MHADSLALKKLLMSALYRHPQVMRTTGAARGVVRELFAAYVANPHEMAEEFARRTDRHRAVADYVAGMTDRFASREHLRLTGRDVFALAPASLAAPSTANPG